MTHVKHCPACKSSQIRRSRRRGIERILLPFAMACRCNECGRRFYAVHRKVKQAVRRAEEIVRAEAPYSHPSSKLVET